MTDNKKFREMSQSRFDTLNNKKYELKALQRN